MFMSSRHCLLNYRQINTTHTKWYQTTVYSNVYFFMCEHVRWVSMYVFFCIFVLYLYLYLNLYLYLYLYLYFIHRSCREIDAESFGQGSIWSVIDLQSFTTSSKFSANSCKLWWMCRPHIFTCTLYLFFVSSDRSSYSDSSLREIHHPVFEISSISANILSFSSWELNADW